MNNFFSIDQRLMDLAAQAEETAREAFRRIDENCEYNSAKVLSAFIRNRVSESHLKGTTGYGYGDRGRDDLDRVFADIFGTEDALVRHTFVSGTHALATALFGVLRPGDRMVSVTGSPYDTMEETIGLRGEGTGSLGEFGVTYSQVDLLPDGTPDYEGIRREAKGARMVYLQRSRGYSLRPSLNIETIRSIIAAAREVNPDAIVMVDNCYGELVERLEPTQVGADLVAGSLIKNLGGGIAPTGGYIAGRRDLVEQCGYRLTCPGMGKEVGCTLDVLRSMYLGLFNAPAVVAAALKTAAFAAAFYSLLGFQVTPTASEERTDIIQSVLCGGPEQLIAFCQGIQKGSPVDSFAAPEPWDMPGYDSQVIMAAGAFTMGASIELSADAPLREPYAAWLQGGLTYPTGKIGVILSAQEMLERGLLKL
ncbi:aminotransferase class I/II-fold pyridoxal phosphate-dependent enzyme [Angelakisella massiliensis]|uniref:methionine gamma-lyase family protein n=1 Tax=Angelakisella massiliensis TaxID=1871018 RepID=UPI0008F84E3C|nr:methionine gamma-lyase family protein [Angelakisella massiliensis]